VAGELSLAQAHEIAKSQDAIRDQVLKRADSARLHEVQRRRRHCHHWFDRYGMVRLSVAFTPDVGVPIVNRLEADAERLRVAARRTQVEEPFHAHACDALAGMLTGDGPGRSTHAELVLVCSLNAYRRGHAHAGEVSQIRGGGPIPVERLRELSEDAFIKAVLQDGVRIDTVKHFGRHIKAELRTALELGPPPAFDGAVCVEPQCGRRYGLEWDHVDPLAHRGPTSYENLQPRCWPHHRDKTDRDRAAGLLARGPT
jgi:hypothetical protein